MSMRWLVLLGLASCAPSAIVDSTTGAPIVIDRFSAAAGTLQVRAASNGLPGPGEPVDFDRPPFITQSWGPGGEVVRYYNFDVQPTAPAAMYVFYVGDRELTAQHRIVDRIPGMPGYSDFVRVVRVAVPPSYVPDDVRSVAGIRQAGFAVGETSQIVNRPIVPPRSRARARLNGASDELEAGWFRGERVYWFRFDEAPLLATPDGAVPTSPISVTFNRNPDQAGGGPSSGFRTEPDHTQTHNVVSSLPGDVEYSPLWRVSVYDNAAFATVVDAETLRAAPVKARDVASVNCPIVFVRAR